jgi:FAD:protein FMN transferase
MWGLADGAIASSGDYECSFEIDGRRYGHILDPGSGMPVTTWQSLSIVLCGVAGSRAAIAMLLGRKAFAALRKQRVDFVAVAADDSIYGKVAGSK